jgi:hypothetical protein
MPSYPYYTEPTHDQGVVTNAAGNTARDTTISNAEGRLVIDAVDKVFLLEPTRHPLTTLLNEIRVSDGSIKGSRIMKAVTTNPEFKWFEDHYGGRYAKVAVTNAAGDSSVDVTGAGTNSAYIFTAGDVVKNARTGEVFVVTAVTDGNTIAITRSLGATAAAIMTAGDGLFIIGNANEENAGARNVNQTRASSQTNYTQIFRTTIALSGTEDAVKLYGGRDLPTLRSKKATEHALDIERAFWFGEKASDNLGTQTNHARRATGGVLEFLEGGNSYIQNQGGPLTAPDMNTFLRESFTYGNGTKTLFAGGQLIQAINEIARGQLQTSMSDSTYGIKISKWTTSFGDVNIVHNPLFVEDYASYGFLLDLDCFRYRFIAGRDTQLRTNIQAPDIDGIVDEYLTECGLERREAPKHSIIKGVTN